MLKWILCKDRLPENCGSYLVYDSEGLSSIYPVNQGFYSDATGDYIGGWGDWNGCRIYPTHWAVMPEPPK